MKIDEILDDCVVAMFRDGDIAKALVLKGGSALRIFGDDSSRLSIDVDFSAEHALENSVEFFERVRGALSSEFAKHGFAVIDFKYERRPTRPRKNAPQEWGGWCCSFKLVADDHIQKALDIQRRCALIPEGANSSIITIDISEYEYCGALRTRTIDGVEIHGYTRELLVLEKLRAICQQHPSYPFAMRKTRSRDFFDIYRLSSNIDDAMIRELARHIERVFQAKKVPLTLLECFWEESFIDEQRRGFAEVEATLRQPGVEFDVCVEHVRYLLIAVVPDIAPKRIRG